MAFEIKTYIASKGLYDFIDYGAYVPVKFIDGNDMSFDILTNNNPTIEWFILSLKSNISTSLGSGIDEIVQNNNRDVHRFTIDLGTAKARYNHHVVYAELNHNGTKIDGPKFIVSVVRPKGAKGIKGRSAIEAGVAPGVGDRGPDGSPGTPGYPAYPGANGADGAKGLDGKGRFLGFIMEPIDIVNGSQTVIDKVLINYRLKLNLIDNRIPRIYLRGTTYGEGSDYIQLLSSVNIEKSIDNRSYERSAVFKIRPGTYTQLQFMIVNISSMLEIRAIKLLYKNDKAVVSRDVTPDYINAYFQADGYNIADGLNRYILGVKDGVPSVLRGIRKDDGIHHYGHLMVWDHGVRNDNLQEDSADYPYYMNGTPKTIIIRSDGKATYANDVKQPYSLYSGGYNTKYIPDHTKSYSDMSQSAATSWWPRLLESFNHVDDVSHDFKFDQILGWTKYMGSPSIAVTTDNRYALWMVSSGYGFILNASDLSETTDLSYDRNKVLNEASLGNNLSSYAIGSTKVFICFSSSKYAIIDCSGSTMGLTTFDPGSEFMSSFLYSDGKFYTLVYDDGLCVDTVEYSNGSFTVNRLISKFTPARTYNREIKNSITVSDGKIYCLVEVDSDFSSELFIFDLNGALVKNENTSGDNGWRSCYGIFPDMDGNIYHSAMRSLSSYYGIEYNGIMVRREDDGSYTEVFRYSDRPVFYMDGRHNDPFGLEYINNKNKWG